MEILQGNHVCSCLLESLLCLSSWVLFSSCTSSVHPTAAASKSLSEGEKHIDMGREGQEEIQKVTGASEATVASVTSSDDEAGIISRHTMESSGRPVLGPWI